jgi:hypothetical protein
MDDGIDTGEIITQFKFPFSQNHTMKELYSIAHDNLQIMFKRNWETIKRIIGSYHSVREFDRVKHILEPEGWDITVGELQRRYNELCVHSGEGRK